ncbi:MAG: hypothetical protein A3F84_24670 [Candidatus Handelsmanbacteria bacterium RIFCSPLOWO2_12_FULL_64_10]|uniref:site-specific DNA-methyltransferase (adenine-specific) n=1 Tax=Handelsmanbacteria sp. (strain RIFCSPLOWO2_12_FULL_64_10) TaxID=1817868 RepID=A0A1F6C2H4_HANXR|nr:MAG: hypothetical protein A3F84_24670 [Candidatus Handelsmanbacteria bacterium RIFCSPLOWO2_12_FULL_64_10]
MATYPSIRIEGGLLGPDLLDQLFAADLPGQRPADFGLDARRNLTDEIAAVFSDARALWGVFRNRLQRLPAADPATTVTRDAWVIPFLGLLGYELRYNPRAYEVDGLTFAISHRAAEGDGALPIHIVGVRQELGRAPASGRPRLAPHSLLQEYLNRTEHLWGLVTNGLILRLLRDSTFVRRQAYVEFDLQGILEEQRFQDFAALYRLLHRTRLPSGATDAGDCLLEQYYAYSEEQGGRVREHLRDGVEQCITLLANGFLRHRNNDDLRHRVSAACTGNEHISAGDLYRQLLRLVYRFLFLLVSEDRGLVSSDPIYREHYGVARLRRLLDQRAAFTDHDDLYQSLKVLWKVLCDDRLAPILQIAPLNGELFAPQKLDAFTLTNRDLLDAFWRLAWYQESASSPPRRVNYAALNVEELGSVYESLLEFHPHIAELGRTPAFELLLEGRERRSTGSHYTPPELVAPLIQHALEPALEERLSEAKRMANGERRAEGEKAYVYPVLSRGQRSGGAASQSPAQPYSEERFQRLWRSTPFATRHLLLAEEAILRLRVCDLACGSGHFLLAAARHLGKELARIRTGEDEPAPERVREAIRDVVTHCIYGVDKNPLAVELCRVALWIESHAEGKPLTFLDHRIRCGDSLVGIFDLQALKHGIPDEAFKAVAGDDKAVAREAKKRNARECAESLFQASFAEQLAGFAGELRKLDELPEDTIEQVRTKADACLRIERNPDFERLRLACDVWTTAFFQPFPNPACTPLTTDILRTALSTGRIPNARLAGFVFQSAVERRFFHWPLAFPEVFSAGCFDVILGNPPFLGGLKISTEFGDKYWHYLTCAFVPYFSTADLCALFFRRAFDALKPDGSFALIGTNTIGQGDTRQAGLAVVRSRGGTITFAKRFMKWPGVANVEVSFCAIHKGPVRDHFLLDGTVVQTISTRLDAEEEAEPFVLQQNADKSFIGSYVLGMGYIMAPEEAQRLIEVEPRNRDCLFPYLNGQDLNSQPDHFPTRWIINFFDWPLERAEEYPALIQIVREKVKPERDKVKRDRNRLRWWLYAENRPGLYSNIKPLQRILIRSEVSENHMLSFVPRGWVYSHMVVIFAFDDYFHFALLQSNVHEAWVWKNASSLESRNRYTPTDCFETFAFPQVPSSEARAEAERVGEVYHEHRRQTMLARQLGLTKTYNLFHNPQCEDADIARLRELHTTMDRAVLACYGWTDLDPGHGFHVNERGQTRYTISPPARREVLRRLLALNLEIAGREAGVSA